MNDSRSPSTALRTNGRLQFPRGMLNVSKHSELQQRLDKHEDHERVANDRAVKEIGGNSL